MALLLKNERTEGMRFFFLWFTASVNNSCSPWLTLTGPCKQHWSPPMLFEQLQACLMAFEKVYQPTYPTFLSLLILV